MKARIVLIGLLVSMVVSGAFAQRAEYDDMYFRAKDRERNKALDAEEAYASAKPTKQKQDEMLQEEDNTNPTDSYSARNVNPEYVSRSNSEKASEDESNYYVEGYAPAFAKNDFNNSYYNNTNMAASSYYANNWNSPYSYYGNCGYCGPAMSPYYGGGFYDPWMSPAYAMGPSYGWHTGLSVSLMYGNYANPYGGYGYNPYYGGYGYPYYGGNGYYESPRVVNYGKRPSRHSAVVQPAQRTDTRSRNTMAENVTTISSGSRTRQRQTQDEYYVRPARRPSTLDNPSSWSVDRPDNSLFSSPQNTQPTRTRDTYNSPSRTPSYTPSATPSYSPSRSSSGSSGGSGGGSSPRPRGRN